MVIDIATAILTYLAGGKGNLNIRAAFIHNVSDALASVAVIIACLLYTSPSPRDRQKSRMPSSA